MMRLTSPAKLNLFLHITGRRADGYHELQTLFQLLDYGDSMEFTARSDGQIVLQTAMPGVAEADNLILRAARLLRDHGDSCPGINIDIDKQLPMGGGIGGGSSNAATTLLALNRLWQLGLSLDHLAKLGAQLGADVPVFVHGHSAFAEGIGEKLQAVNLPPRYYLILKPDCHVSTAEIFSQQQLTRNTRAITIAAFFEQGGHNDCENVVRQLFPAVDSALLWLDEIGPKYGSTGVAKLTGTGACVFSSFHTDRDARAVLAQVPTAVQGFVARGVDISPTHRQLQLNN